MDLCAWSEPNHHTTTFVLTIKKIPKMHQNHLIFDTIHLNYELHDFVGRTKNIHVIDIITFQK
jgi:hypothetical protein